MRAADTPNHRPIDLENPSRATFVSTTPQKCSACPVDTDFALVAGPISPKTPSRKVRRALPLPARTPSATKLSPKTNSPPRSDKLPAPCKSSKLTNSAALSSPTPCSAGVPAAVANGSLRRPITDVWKHRAPWRCVIRAIPVFVSCAETSPTRPAAARTLKRGPKSAGTSPKRPIGFLRIPRVAPSVIRVLKRTRDAIT